MTVETKFEIVKFARAFAFWSLFLEDAKMNLGHLSTHSTILFLILHSFHSFHGKSDKVDLKKRLQICWIHKRDFQSRTHSFTMLCVFAEPSYTFVDVVHAFSNAYSAMWCVFWKFYKLLFIQQQMQIRKLQIHNCVFQRRTQSLTLLCSFEELISSFVSL